MKYPRNKKKKKFYYPPSRNFRTVKKKAEGGSIIKRCCNSIFTLEGRNDKGGKKEAEQGYLFGSVIDSGTADEGRRVDACMNGERLPTAGGVERKVRCIQIERRPSPSLDPKPQQVSTKKTAKRIARIGEEKSWEGERRRKRTPTSLERLQMCIYCKHGQGKEKVLTR